MPDYFLEILNKLFNYCLIKGYIPIIFKKTKIIPIFKPGKDLKIPSSYRPINIRSLLDKVFEKIINKKNFDFSNKFHTINPQKFGLRKEHSTVYQLKRVVDIFEINKRHRKSTGVNFLYIEKDVGSIWHDGLVFKFNTFNYPT